MSTTGEVNPEEWGYILTKRRSPSSKRTGGFSDARAASDAAQRELQRTSTYDDFRVVAIPPGGDINSL